MKSKIGELFSQGNYQQVLSFAFETNGTAGVSPDNFHWVVGALCFTGRKEEARSLFQEFEASAGAFARAACRFFLGVAFCRHGHYSNASQFFASNLQAHRKSSGELGFFAWQGLAFFRYFCADFKRSENAALKALSHATISRFGYGRSLALDIIGHSLVQQGQVSAGLARLKDAQSSAESLGNGGLSSSILMSVIVYRAQYGFEAKTTLRSLQKALKQTDPQNSYARANILLETANQHSLRGNIASASTALNEATPLIYSSQHRRYSHLLSLRLAEVSYRRGEFAAALHSVRMQRSQLDEKYDLVNLLMALGLEIKLLRALSMDSEIEPLAKLLAKLTRKTPRSISKNIFNRPTTLNELTPADDNVDKIFSALSESQAINAVLQSGFLGLSYEALKLPPGTSWLVSDHRKIIVLDRGEVTRLKSSLPTQLLCLLEALASGLKTKEKLIQKIWGYGYHPLHHDPLLYQAVARLREALGTYGSLIEVTATGYQLRQGFGFIFLVESGVPTASIPTQAREVNGESLEQPSERLESLNSRQIRILVLLKKQEFIGVRDCVKQFHVSEMTLKRDFSGLVQSGRIQRIGKARATCYRLLNRQPSSSVRGRK